MLLTSSIRTALLVLLPHLREEKQPPDPKQGLQSLDSKSSEHLITKLLQTFLPNCTCMRERVQDFSVSQQNTL